MSYKDSVSGIGIIIKNKPQLPYGNGARGRMIPSEKGRRAIFVPSFGVLEEKEVNDLVEDAQGQEDERIKTKQQTQNKENLENLVKATRAAPRGERAKTAREIIKEAR